MARSYAKLKGSIWRDDDWRSLPADEQRLYLLLMSQPEISNCGVIPYLPAKWARMATDTEYDHIVELAYQLQEHRFVVVDEEACEVLVRTFVKHDQVVDQPKIKAAAIRQYEMVQSKRIRTVLASEYPETFQLGAGEHPAAEPYGKGTAYPSESLYQDVPEKTPGKKANERLPDTLSEGYAEGYGIPSRARAQAASRQPQPSNHPRQPPPSSHQQQPATEDAATAAAIEKLSDAGWTDRQTDSARGDLQRAVGLLEQCQADTTSTNPAGLAWKKFEKGEQPAAKPPTHEATHPHGCPHCGVRFKTEARLADHVEVIHAGQPKPELAAEGLAALEAIVNGRASTDADDEPEPAVGPAKPTAQEPTR